jgi:hypothetical protein
LKITASKRDDILKRKQEWQANYDKKKARYDEECNAYKAEHLRRSQTIKEIVESQISKFDILNLDIDVNPNWDNGYEVRIKSNDNRIHSDDKALSWNYNVELSKNGEIKAETNSWSGLQATTRAQLDSLRATVECLEIINDMDWKQILSIKAPEYDDYVKTEVPNSNEGRALDNELFEAELEELIGTNKVVKCRNFKYYNTWVDVYKGIVRFTPKQVEVFEISKDEIDSGDINAINRAKGYTYRENKEDFLTKDVIKPLVIEEI